MTPGGYCQRWQGEHPTMAANRTLLGHCHCDHCWGVAGHCGISGSMCWHALTGDASTERTNPAPHLLPKHTAQSRCPECTGKEFITAIQLLTTLAGPRMLPQLRDCGGRLGGGCQPRVTGEVDEGASHRCGPPMPMTLACRT